MPHFRFSRKRARDVAIQLHDAPGVGSCPLKGCEIRQIDPGALQVSMKLARGNAIARVLEFGRQINAARYRFERRIRDRNMLVGEIELSLYLIEGLALECTVGGLNAPGPARVAESAGNMRRSIEHSRELIALLAGEGDGIREVGVLS